MANMAPSPYEYVSAKSGFSFFSDFVNKLDTTNDWTATLTDTGSATVGSGAGGILPLIPSDGSVADNDEAYLGMSVFPFALAANKDVTAYGRAQFTEANTSAANIFLGLTSSVAANLLVDDGGGVRASGTSFGIYKVDGETVWRCVSRVSSTVSVSQSTETAGGAAYFTWEVEVRELLTTHATVTFKVNGQYLKDALTGQVIRHRIAYAGASALSPAAGVKNGSSSLETLNLDYLGAVQAR